jgi:Flp pilus assembly pilin Flp
MQRSASISRLISDTRGVTSAEYAVLFVVIAVSALTLWIKFGKDITELFI